MRMSHRISVFLAATLFLGVWQAAAQPSGGRTSDDLVSQVAVDIGRKSVAAPAPSTGTGETPPPKFDPVTGLAGRGAAAGSAGDGRAAPVTRVQGSDAKPPEGETPPPAGGGQGGISWDTASTVKPKPARPDLPPWWTMVPEAPSSEKPQSPSRSKADKPDQDRPARDDSGGSLGQKIVDVAQKYVGRRFNYAPGTSGGRLGCANVVSAILKEAGVMKSIMLGVLAVISDLRNRDWKQVRPPPYKDGDVITWATYDRSGDGRVDPDTHIGIISVQGGKVYAINNSSSRRIPVKVELNAMNYPITRVLRAG